jgi:hypothetical protein
MWGVSTREHGIKKSTMLLAIGILYRLGIREVRLIGCDWRATQDAPYGHDHKETDETSVQTSNDHFGYLEEWFTGLLPVMERLGFRIINCTDGGYLEIFERADWMDYLVK